MQKERLLRLAALLERNAANPKGVKFDLGIWAKDISGEKKLDCGTTACAVGLACISGEFAAEGLTWRPRCWNERLIEDCDEIVPKYGNLISGAAVEVFFDIDEHQFTWLFLPESYPEGNTGAEAERAVARRIRRFVAGKARP